MLTLGGFVYCVGNPAAGARVGRVRDAVQP